MFTCASGAMTKIMRDDECQIMRYDIADVVREVEGNAFDAFGETEEWKNLNSYKQMGALFGR